MTALAGSSSKKTAQACKNLAMMHKFSRVFCRYCSKTIFPTRQLSVCRARVCVCVCVDLFVCALLIKTRSQWNQWNWQWQWGAALPKGMFVPILLEPRKCSCSDFAMVPQTRRSVSLACSSSTSSFIVARFRHFDVASGCNCRRCSSENSSN